MKPVLYRDFKVVVHKPHGDVFPLSVESPAGLEDGQLSVDVGLLAPGRKALRSAARPGRGSGVQPLAEAGSVKRMGTHLFDALFDGRIKDLWVQSLADINALTQVGQQVGLRVKLQMNPEVAELARLMALPWEYLYRKDRREYLNLNPRTPVVRYLSVPRPIHVVPLKPPLRILIVMSRAVPAPRSRSDRAEGGTPEFTSGVPEGSGAEPLDLDAERARITKAWASIPGVQIDFLEKATHSALRDRLREEYNVLHFMGHGAFSREGGKGVLVFEAEDGSVREVEGHDLAQLLVDMSSLRLVFLNACDTAILGDDPGQDPFAGVASALVMAGLPAVVAMQSEVSDEAAIIFAATFYGHLAKGMPVDWATTEARRAVAWDLQDAVEWGIPVLFTRTDDGRLFSPRSPDLPGSSPTMVVPPAASSIPPGLEAAVRRRFREAESALLASLPPPEYSRGLQHFEAARDALLAVGEPGLLDVLRESLGYYRRWPASAQLFLDLLQEPLLQACVRQTTPLAASYEALVFAAGEEGSR